MAVIVFGSINMDLVVHTPRIPRVGETLMGTTFITTPGGKGANQAVAAARLGLETIMIGRVGGDHFGQELLESLSRSGVNTAGVVTDPAHHSGIALIVVSEQGENQIIGVLGANGQVGEADLNRLAAYLPQASSLLLQLEVPAPIVQAAATLARQAGVRVILDPAPVPPESLHPLYPLVDILTPNEVEAGQLVGFPVTDIPTAERAALTLQQWGVGAAIVKLGSRGVVCATATEVFHTPAFTIDVVDTVAAGDAFNGALVTALETGLPLRQAVVWGAAAGALVASRAGAQTAMPDRPTLEAFLQQQG